VDRTTRTALVAGLLCLVTFAASIPAVFLLDSVLNDADYIVRQDLAGAPGTGPASLVATGRALVAVRDWTFLLGPSLMPGINALLLDYLLYRSPEQAVGTAGRARYLHPTRTT
jgi:hypothetical protein